MGSTHELPVCNASSCYTMVKWTKRGEGRYSHRLQKRFFSWICFPQPQSILLRSFRIFSANCHQCQRHRRQICHWCRLHRWQIMGAIVKLLTTSNEDWKKCIYMLTLLPTLPKGVQKKSYNWFMKKTRSKKSLDTVPVRAVRPED